MKKLIASCFAAMTMLVIAAPAANAAGVVPLPTSPTTSSSAVMVFN